LCRSPPNGNSGPPSASSCYGWSRHSRAHWRLSHRDGGGNSFRTIFDSHIHTNRTTILNCARRLSGGVPHNCAKACRAILELSGIDAKGLTAVKLSFLRIKPDEETSNGRRFIAVRGDLYRRHAADGRAIHGRGEDGFTGRARWRWWWRRRRGDVV